MAALYIVGIYLELWLRIHMSATGKAQVTVGLLRYRLLCISAYKHLASKDTYRLFIEDVFIQLVTCAMSFLVIYKCAIIDVLFLVAYSKAVYIGLGSFSI